ncbi:hypothetical protein AKJ16_DCAP08237 [Drosera capensis]
MDEKLKETGKHRELAECNFESQFQLTRAIPQTTPRLSLFHIVVGVFRRRCALVDVAGEELKRKNGGFEETGSLPRGSTYEIYETYGGENVWIGDDNGPEW